MVVLLKQVSTVDTGDLHLDTDYSDSRCFILSEIYKPSGSQLVKNTWSYELTKTVHSLKTYQRKRDQIKTQHKTSRFYFPLSHPQRNKFNECNGS